MVTQQVSKSFGFLKTTAIGGIFFLLPVVVIAVLLGKVVQVLWVIALQIGKYLPSDTPLNYVLLFLAAVALVILLCFFCGVLARRAFAMRFTSFVEKYLLMMFPRYAIFKEQLSGNIGGEICRNRLRPVLVQFDDYQRLAFEVEETTGETATIYLPGSPDPWTGTVILIARERVKSLTIEFGVAVGTMETLGHDLQKLLAAPPTATQAIPAATPATTSTGTQSAS